MSPAARQRILVTGGAGFIGSHLVERLLADGERVTVIDDVSTGSWDNLAAVRGHPDLITVESKVSACRELPELMADARAVYHLAATVGVDLVMRSGIDTIHNNLFETTAILEAAAAHRVPLLLTSTSEVYGKSAKEEFSEENDLLIGPPHLHRWSYACSKLMDEFLALAYGKERGLPVILVRLFNTVGPRQSGRNGMVLPRFIEAARAGEPLRVFGDGSQTRCFCHVADVVEALVRLMACREAFGEVVNVGNPEEVTIRRLAEMVLAAMGDTSSDALRSVPYAEAHAPGFEDMLRRKPAIAKLTRLTGFTPGRSLAEIVRELVGHGEKLGHKEAQKAQE